MTSKQLYTIAQRLWQQFSSAYDDFLKAYKQKNKQAMLVAYSQANAAYTSLAHHIERVDNGFFGDVKDQTDNFLSSKKYLSKMEEYLKDMQAKMRAVSGKKTEYDDSRLDELNSEGGITDPSQITTIGDLTDYIRTQAGATEGTEQKGYVDMLAQLLSDQQKYKWQQESDDLAYQRTNQYTLVAQLVAMGMSRQAAIAAVSGSAGDVTGSGVGASLSPDLAGVGLGMDQNALMGQGQAMNYQIGLDANNNQRAAINQQQQLISEQARSLQLQNQQVGDNLAALDAIRETYGHVYGMHAYGMTVPTSATISQTAFKDWLRDRRDSYSEIQRYLDGELFTTSSGEKTLYWKTYRDVDGNICATECDSNGNPIEVEIGTYADGKGTISQSSVVTLITANEMGFLKEANDAYASIQKNIDNPYYGTWFENFFMSNAGPRAWHEQEEVSMYEMNKLKVAQGALVIQQMQQDMFSAEATAAAQANIALVLQEGGEQAVVLNRIIADNGWVTDPSSGQVVDATGKVVSGFDLFKSCCPESAMFFMEQFKQLNQYQVLVQSTDKDVFNYTLEGLRVSAENKTNQAKIQQNALRYAADWFQNSKFLSGASAIKMVLDLTGASSAAGAVFNVASQVATGGFSAMFQQRLQDHNWEHRAQYQQGKPRLLEVSRYGQNGYQGTSTFQYGN